MIVPLVCVAQDTVIQLRIAHFAPPESMVDEIMKAGADWLEKRFPGRIKCTIYPFSALLPTTASYEGAVKGIADIAIVVPQWTPGRFPKSEVIDLPPGVPSALDATNVYWGFFNKFLADEWQEVKVLSLHVQVAHGIHSRNKAIRTFEDIKGQKMRVYGIGTDIMKAFGGIPVSMPASEAYDAMRQGIVSGTMIVFSDMKASRLIDVCKFHTEADIFASPFLIVMNKGKWASLPADIRETMDKELAPYWNKKGGEIWDKWEAIGKEFVRKTPGHEYITLSPAEKKLWRERAMTVNAKWASAIEAKGLPGKKLVDEKLKAIDKYIK
jgi:TRAP-type C4-dicarboxylate transport system substrate-binding protein